MNAKYPEKYNLKKYNLSQWEIDVLIEFDTEMCLSDLMNMIQPEDMEEFLSTLADSLVSFDNRKKG